MKNSRLQTQHMITGFSLLEMMAALVISLVIGITLMEIASTFKNQNIYGNRSNNFTQSALYSINQMQQVIGQAGNGFADAKSIAYGCVIKAAKNNTAITLSNALPTPFNALTPATVRLSLAPVVIINGAGNNSDIIMTMTGSTSSAITGTKLISPPSATELAVYSTTGFRIQDKILLVNDDEFTNPVGNCLLEEITQVAGFPTNQISLGNTWHASANAPILTSFLADAVVLNLGYRPQIALWGIDTTSNLVKLNLLSNDTTPTNETIADEVVNLQALYGISTTNPPSATLDRWVEPRDVGPDTYAARTLTNNSQTSKVLLQRIRAIRIGFLLRSKTVTKTNNVFESTPSVAFFADLTPTTLRRTIPITLAEQKYHYRVYETTIVLRNSKL